MQHRDKSEDAGRLTQRAGDLAFSLDIDSFGVAPARRFENVPAGHEAEDLMPGAESVISRGVRVGLGPQIPQRMALARDLPS